MLRPPFAAFLVVCGVALGAASPTFAAKKVEVSRSALVQALSDCRKLTDDAFRLACYDKAAASFDQAEQQGQLVVMDREQVKTVRRQAFGFALPAFDVFGHGAKEEKIDKISETVESARLNGEGHWVMTMADGATWVQIDSEHVENSPVKGSNVKIRAASLGSFFCNIDGQYAVRCERQR